MADVFVSYDSDDRDRVAPLIQAIEGAGFSVWWDSRIGAGFARFSRASTGVGDVEPARVVPAGGGRGFLNFGN